MFASLPVPELSLVPLWIELHPCKQHWEIWRKKPNVDKAFEELNPSSPLPSLSHLKAENSFWARHALSFPYLKAAPKYHPEIMLSERRPRSRFPLRDSAASFFLIPSKNNCHQIPNAPGLQQSILGTLLPEWYGGIGGNSEASNNKIHQGLERDQHLREA